MDPSTLIHYCQDQQKWCLIKHKLLSWAKLGIYLPVPIIITRVVYLGIYSNRNWVLPILSGAILIKSYFKLLPYPQGYLNRRIKNLEQAWSSYDEALLQLNKYRENSDSSRLQYAKFHIKDGDIFYKL